MTKPNASALDQLTLDDVRAAHARIGDAVVRTPMLKSQTLSQIAGAEIWLKFENLQFTAAYKERGALNKLLTLTPQQRARGIVVASTGNHGAAQQGRTALTNHTAQATGRKQVARRFIHRLRRQRLRAQLLRRQPHLALIQVGYQQLGAFGLQ